MFMWCLASKPMWVWRFGSHTTTSASAPGAMMPLVRVHAEHAGRGGAAGLDPALEGDLAVDDALVEQLHPVLDAGHAVGDLGEVAATQLLLVLEAERAVVGADDGEVVGAQALPQVGVVRVVVVGRADRRRAHPLGALEVGLGQRVLDRQVEVLRAGLGEHVAARVAGLGHVLEGLRRRQVDDVERHVAGHRGQHDGPVGGLALQRRRPGPRVVDRVGLAPRRGPAAPARRWRCRSRRAS